MCHVTVAVPGNASLCVMWLFLVWLSVLIINILWADLYGVFGWPQHYERPSSYSTQIQPAVIQTCALLRRQKADALLSLQRHQLFSQISLQTKSFFPIFCVYVDWPCITTTEGDLKVECLLCKL